MTKHTGSKNWEEHVRKFMPYASELTKTSFNIAEVKEILFGIAKRVVYKCMGTQYGNS